MTARLLIHQAGPSVTVQDAGRLGRLGQGVGEGGAADRLALVEGAALLGQSPHLAALELAGLGGLFEATQDLRIALTGAPMRATLDGRPLRWNAAHALPKGARLQIGAVTRGVYGYLHVGGGIDTDPLLGARATHLLAGLGRALQAGDSLPLGRDPGGPVDVGLDIPDRTQGGVLRVLDTFQTPLFAPEMQARFYATVFQRDARANRMGVRLAWDAASGGAFQAEDQLSLVSDFAIPGDIQMTGDGAPAILLVEAQTTAGYPRLGTVLPCDLPRVAQAGPGVPIRFQRVSRSEAVAIQRAAEADQAALPRKRHPLHRDPGDIPDLLGYQLVGGVISATQDPWDEE